MPLNYELLQEVQDGWNKSGFVPMPGGQTEPVAGASPMTAGMGAPVGGAPTGGAPMGGAPPGAAPAPGGAVDPALMQQLTQNPDLLQQLMQDPAMAQQMGLDPAMLEQIISSMGGDAAMAGMVSPGMPPSPEEMAAPAPEAPPPEVSTSELATKLDELKASVDDLKAKLVELKAFTQLTGQLTKQTEMLQQVLDARGA